MESLPVRAQAAKVASKVPKAFRVHYLCVCVCVCVYVCNLCYL